MKAFFIQFISWVKTWDFMAILYSVLGSIVFALLLKWSGFLGFLRRNYTHIRGMRSYRKTLSQKCSSLVVIGRRQGFSTADVYIPLDLAPSDLMQEKKEEKSYPRGSYVLVGGPGTGKSTKVKKEVLERLESSDSLPVFLSLREYIGFESIKSYIIHKFSSSNIPNAESILNKELSKGNFLCILDGLDEVRPQLRDKICKDINHFYSSYFISKNKLIVTCRKEAYRDIPLDISSIWEVRPLSDGQIRRFVKKWPLGFPDGKSDDTFWRDLASTPRILELARSPLLLVGGLMQYTESNLGIPDERFEYLARISSWLIVEWAAAQGHPPDPYRPLYDRILPRMAFSMHDKGKSEFPISEAREQLSEWLPIFGYESTDAEIILKNIATKTGIIVNEGGFVVFSQFGFQEYFVSLEILQHIEVHNLYKLQPKSWWREVILFTAAQQREPTPLLEALFETDPLLAAAAVAECPTPPVMIQEKAISACVSGVDSKDKKVAGALIPLLRKVRGKIEVQLCSALEYRMEREPEIASAVGLSLAIAGTTMATKTLAKHPDVWATCLKEAGYLSTSFENLLIDWIQDGDDFQSKHATELILTKLSKDLLSKLISILPKLTDSRAENLSILLLKYLEIENYSDTYRHGFSSGNYLLMTCQCVQNIKNPNKFITQKVSGEKDRPPYFSGLDGEVDVQLSALFLEEHAKRPNVKSLMHRLVNSICWSLQRGSLFVWICSALVISQYGFSLSVRMLIFLPITFFLILFLFRPICPLPWGLAHWIHGQSKPSIHILLILIGCCYVLSLGGHLPFLPIGNQALLGTIILSLCFSVMGLIFWNKKRWFEPNPSEIVGYHYAKWPTYITQSTLIFMMGIVVLYYLNLIHEAPFIIQITLKLLSIVYLSLMLILASLVYYNWILVRRASNTAKKIISDEFINR